MKNENFELWLSIGAFVILTGMVLDMCQITTKGHWLANLKSNFTEALISLSPSQHKGATNRLIYLLSVLLGIDIILGIFANHFLLGGSLEPFELLFLVGIFSIVILLLAFIVWTILIILYAILHSAINPEKRLFTTLSLFFIFVFVAFKTISQIF